MPFKDMKLDDFLGSLASGDPTPGGGAAAAVVGAMGAALVSMVANVTTASREYSRVHGKAEATAGHCDELRAKLVSLADDDALAFDGYMRALKMPKNTPSQCDDRAEAICEAAKQAARVPLDMIGLCVEVAAYAVEAASRWSAAARSDAIEAAILARAAGISAALNVRANLPYTKDDSFNRDAENRIRRALEALSKYQDEAEGRPQK